MPKDREHYDDEDPWDLHEDPSTHGEQLELPLQYSSNSKPTVTADWNTAAVSKHTGYASYTGYNAAPTASNAAVMQRIEEIYQQIMDRFDALEDAVSG